MHINKYNNKINNIIIENGNKNGDIPFVSFLIYTKKYKKNKILHIKLK